MSNLDQELAERDNMTPSQRIWHDLQTIHTQPITAQDELLAEKAEMDARNEHRYSNRS